jgi:DNA polymerase III delta prime subunit
MSDDEDDKPSKRKPKDDNNPEAVGARLMKSCGELIDIRLPAACEEPILAPSVRRAVIEWMTEIHMAEELKAVGLVPRYTSLLYGPPGTGKTTLAHHFAARLGMPLVIVRGELVTSKWLGETGNNIGRLFNYFRVEQGHFVAFFDELDSLASTRGGTDSSAGKERNAIVAALLTNIEAFEGIFFAATNRQDSLDPAIWRRFGMQLEVALPGFEERFAILRRYGLPFEFSDDFLDELALGTETAAPSLLRQVMEGFKRTLVIGPRLKRDISDPTVLLRSIVAAVRPHPDYSTPPLWTSQKAVDGFVKFKGESWPPARMMSK